MEEPPSSKGDLQPQDLSTCSAVIDLTRNGEECALDTNSLDALHMVKSASWYPNSGNNNNALSFSDTAPPDSSLQSGDQTQPDKAFSNTTVTFSYVSRSHIFPSHGSPPISRFSLLPSCEVEKDLGQAGYGLSQRYLEPGDGPLDLGAHADLCEAPAEACVGPESADAGACVTRCTRRFNGDVAVENGQDHSWSGSSLSPEDSTAQAGDSGDSEVLFLVSRTREQVEAQDCVSARGLCMISREYISPLDPASPSATSLEDVEEVLLLPQASSSPSAHGGADRAGCLGGDGTAKQCLSAASSNGEAPALLDASGDSSLLLRRHQGIVEPVIDLTGDGDLLPDALEDKRRKALPHVNGNARILQRAVAKKELPPRSGRGTRLEAIVLNINSNRYKVLDCVHTAKQTSTAQTSASVISLASPKKKAPSFVGKNKVGIVPVAVNSKQIKCVKMTSPKRVKAKSTGLCKESTSHSPFKVNSKNCLTSTPPTVSASPPCCPRLAVRRTPRKKTAPSSTPRPPPAYGCAAQKVASKEPESPEPVVQTPPTTPKTSPGKHKGKTSPPTKSKSSPPAKRRRKKQQVGHAFPASSLFSPREPEIKLRYVHYKEERRELRPDTFSPFVRVESKRSSCTVVNYPEEEALPRASGSGAVPATSCLRLGRPSAHGRRHSALVCCLCGGPANAMDLGDLHGPYYPEGRPPAIQGPGGVARGLQGAGEVYSDSDSSSSSGHTPPTWPSSPRAGVKDWYQAPSGSPAAKRLRAEVKDWYSAPLVSLEPCEYWLHEDCGVWSDGVFLVKGRLYGLEEAVAVAQETLCSGCCNPGATLGCFFKGCPNTYHYRCALQSDCVLIEDNFSLKCKKHKYKMLKAPPGSRWLDR